MNCNHVHLNLGGGKLYQFANRNNVQMMSYLIETPDGKLIMIDGGNPCDEDADFLEDFLIKKGGYVTAWFMTHAHDDHFGALSVLLGRDKFNLNIESLYFDFPPLEWIEKTEKSTYPFLSDFLNRVQSRGLKTRTIGAGEIFDWGVKLEVLNSLGDYNRFHSINDTSIVLKAHFPKRSVLFLGDLAIDGQLSVIKEAGEKLKCDIVQMAHHGQRGVNFEMYRLIEPKICLWCAPDWLWNNDIGEGYGSGPWLTLETRKWMEQLGAQASFPTAYGDYEFD